MLQTSIQLLRPSKHHVATITVTRAKFVAVAVLELNTRTCRNRARYPFEFVSTGLRFKGLDMRNLHPGAIISVAPR